MFRLVPAVLLLFPPSLTNRFHADEVFPLPHIVPSSVAALAESVVYLHGGFPMEADLRRQFRLAVRVLLVREGIGEIELEAQVLVSPGGRLGDDHRSTSLLPREMSEGGVPTLFLGRVVPAEVADADVPGTAFLLGHGGLQKWLVCLYFLTNLEARDPTSSR